MVEAINKYEAIMVIDVDKSEEETNAIIDRVKNLITENGELTSVDVWGKRRLAYPINFKNEGFYVLINFTAKPAFPRELERIFRITEGIIRSIVVRNDIMADE